MSKKPKFELHNWAVEMDKLARTILPKFKGMAVATEDGFYCKAKKGRSLIKLFKLCGFKPYEQIPDFFVIEARESDLHGISVDFRTDMVEEKGKCIVCYFNDEGC